MKFGSTSEDIKCIPVFALMEVSNEYILAVQLKKLYKTKLHRELFNTNIENFNLISCTD